MFEQLRKSVHEDITQRSLAAPGRSSRDGGCHRHRGMNSVQARIHGRLPCSSRANEPVVELFAMRIVVIIVSVDLGKAVPVPPNPFGIRVVAPEHETGLAGRHFDAIHQSGEIVVDQPFGLQRWLVVIMPDRSGRRSRTRCRRGSHSPRIMSSVSSWSVFKPANRSGCLFGHFACTLPKLHSRPNSKMRNCVRLSGPSSSPVRLPSISAVTCDRKYRCAHPPAT